MTKINWARFFLGGLIATVLLFVSDGMLHENVFKSYWEAVYVALGVKPPAEGHSLDLVYFFVFEIGRGFGAMFVYILMRPFHGAGPKTAVLAAVATWLAFSVTGPAEFIPLGFYSNALWVGVAGAQFVTSIVTTLIAGILYKDPAGA